MPGLRVGFHLALDQGRPVFPQVSSPSRGRNLGRSLNPWSCPPGRPVRINCVLGNQFESSQLHHALCPQRVSCTFCRTARLFKGLARRFLRSCVSGGALARGFVVSAPPISASWKPFPGAESRDWFASVGERFAFSPAQNAETGRERRRPVRATTRTPSHPLAFNSAHGADRRPFACPRIVGRSAAILFQ